MFFSRMGKKTKMAKEIIKYFPPHKAYIELFFGGGGLYFNKPLVQYNFLNDYDKNILNVFTEIVLNQDKLINLIEATPYSEEVFKWLKLYKGEDKLLKALKFLYLAEYSFFGGNKTLRLGFQETKAHLLRKINQFIKSPYFNQGQFLCKDFRDVLKSINWCTENEKTNSFMYLDPPYLDTGNNYIIEGKKCVWTKKDVDDLFKIAVESGVRFAMSEFDNEYILAKAKEYNLNIIIIGERRSLLNRRTEILITNYEINKNGNLDYEVKSNEKLPMLDV